MSLFYLHVFSNGSLKIRTSSYASALESPIPWDLAESTNIGCVIIFHHQFLKVYSTFTIYELAQQANNQPVAVKWLLANAMSHSLMISSDRSYH